MIRIEGIEFSHGCGSNWVLSLHPIIKVRSGNAFSIKSPTRAVWGLFRSFLQTTLLYPPARFARSARFPLVHNFTSDDGMEAKNVLI